MSFALLRLLVTCSALLSSVASQTDWSGGPGAEGPVTDWSSCFYDSEEIAWLSIPGQLCLSSSVLNSPVQHMLSMTYAGAYCARVGDLNGDGLYDIVATAHEAGEVRLWLADGEGGWDQHVAAEDEWLVCCDIADIDEDGMLDILVTNYQPGRVQIYYNQGGSVPQWELQIVDSEIRGGHDLMAVDLDEDGDLDIAASAALDDVMHWWRNDGGSPIVWTKMVVGSTGYPCRFDVADLDGDDNLDVVVAALDSDRVDLWYGSGGPDPGWTHQVVSSPVNGCHGVRVCDVDGDGDPDVVASAMNGGTVFWMRNDGGYPVTWVRVEIGVFAGSSCVETGDLDGDGDYDVSSGSFGAAGIAWWENQDDGTSWVKHQLATGMGTFPLALPADVDMDGDLDVVGCGASASRFLWFEISEFLSSGSLESSILDTGCDPQYASFDWDAEIPASTDVTFQFRTSDNPSTMGSWSAEYSSPACISGLVDRYFQYRVNLSTSDEGASPILREILFGWDPTCIEEGTMEGSLTIQAAGGNPVQGDLQLEVAHPLDGTVQLLLYDMSGRAVRCAHGSLEGGCPESFVVHGLPSGTYFVRGIHSSGDESALSVVQL